MLKESCQAEVASVVIKPDAVRYILDNHIISEIERNGLRVLRQITVHIDESLVARIYPDKVDDPLFSSNITAMTAGPAILLLVEGDDAHQRLNDFKGDTENHGIRYRYRIHTKEQLEALGYEGKQLYDKLFENLIHTPNNIKESASLALLLLQPHDIERMRADAPQLYGEIKQRTALALLDDK